MWQLSLLILCTVLSAQGSDNKCRVLALGGGTDKGAYTAGAVIGLINNLPSGEAHWDVVTGVGDGALNAYIVAQSNIGKESEAASTLQSFWENFSYSDFYEDWPGWFVTGLLVETGIYDAKNMHETVDKLGRTNAFGRFISVGTTDLITGGYVLFNNTDISFDIMKTGVKASVTKAGIFQYIPYRSWRLVDGSIKFALDALSGINACNDMGYDDSQIIIDAITCSGKTIGRIDASNYKTLQVGLRYLNIYYYDATMQIIDNIKHDHSQVTVRSKIYPSQNIPDNMYPYDFTVAELKDMINLGIQDAKNSVSGYELETN